MNVNDLFTEFEWKKSSSWLEDRLYIGDDLVALCKNPEIESNRAVSVVPHFFKHFTPTNISMEMCLINKLLKVEHDDFKFYGHTLSNVMWLTFDYTQICTFFEFHKTETFHAVDAIVREHWEMLENLAAIYTKPLPSGIPFHVAQMIKGKEYNPLDVLGFLGLGDDPSERSAFMQDNKEALILKMVLCDSGTMDKTFTDIKLILTPLEFEYENHTHV